MLRQPQISDIAHRILDKKPDAVVRYRLQRDVLKIPASDLFVEAATLNASPWVRQLAAEQHADGSWGRFHSRDSQSKQKILTTEIGVARGLALGLDASHPVFCRVVDYLAQLLQGDLPFPDPAEHNDRWPVGVQLFVAATFAQLKPNHPFLDEAWNLWLEIASRTFLQGRYDAKAEIEAHRKLTGATIKDSYLVLNNKYAILLLSARPNEIPAKLQQQLGDWLWQHAQGLRYLGVPAAKLLNADAHPTVIDHWFTTHEILARLPCWQHLAGDFVTWLWKQQQEEDGLWDFGLRNPSSHYFPLSANWRSSHNRKFDWSTRVLSFLTLAK